jgi:hypothetical protein
MHSSAIGGPQPLSCQPIGRIFLGAGAPHDRPPWSWSCHLPGWPQARNDRGSGVDLDDAKTQFKAAWMRFRAGLTDQDVADAHRAMYPGGGCRPRDPHLIGRPQLARHPTRRVGL